MTLPGTPNIHAVFAWLIIGHFLCDYPLQGDFLARAKNQKRPLPNVPWYQALVAHCAIQAGMVWFVTGLWQCALIEYIAHSIIDYEKSEEHISFDVDQALHLFTKVCLILMLAALGRLSL